MATIKLQVRRDLATNWTNANPTMLPGEIGFETDTGKIKIGKELGDLWNDLAYLSVGSHQHPVSDLQTTGTASSTRFLSGTGVWTALNISHIEDLQTDLNDKADAVHAHTVANVTDFSSAVDTKTAALLAANQTVAGDWTFTMPLFALSDLGNVTGAVALNLSNHCFFKATITGAVTLSITSSLSGTNIANLGIVLVNPSTNITWPASFKWSGGTAPTLTATGTDLLTFISFDNGTTWLNVGQSFDIK
jgi:hypothetical protein